MAGLSLSLPAEFGSTGTSDGNGTDRGRSRRGEATGEPRIVRWLACWAGT